MTRLRPIAISFLIGIALACGFQANFWFLPIIALAGFFYQLNSQNTRARLLSAGIVSATWFGIHVFWMVSIGIDAWILLVMVCVLPWLLIIWCSIPARGWAKFVAPMAFVFLIEWIRSNLPWSGFPWGLLAYSQVDGPLIWISRLGGQELVSSAVVICAISLWQISVRDEVRKALFCISLIALFATIGRFTVNNPTGTTRIAVIQGSVPTDSVNLETQQTRVLANHIRVTTKLASDVAAGRQTRPDLVIWPENATDFDPVNNLLAHAQIQAVVDLMQTPILIGGVTWQANPNGPRNAGLLWYPKTGIRSIYAKRQLVPFGEYIPMRAFVMSHVGRLSQIPTDFVPGKSAGVFDLRGTKFGDVICFEVAYQNHLRNLMVEGANFLTVQTNNATYINRGQAQQQFAIARFRAIEHSRSTAVASTTGLSGIISANGQIQAVTREGQSTYLIEDIDLHSHVNLTDRYPNVLRTVLLLGCCQFVLLRVITMMRRRNRADIASQ